jgi:hypothetical protein
VFIKACTTPTMMLSSSTPCKDDKSRIFAAHIVEAILMGMPISGLITQPRLAIREYVKPENIDTQLEITLNNNSIFKFE